MAAHCQIQASETAKHPAPHAPFNDVSRYLSPGGPGWGAVSQLSRGRAPSATARLPPRPPSDFAFDSWRAQPDSRPVPSRSAAAKGGTMSDPAVCGFLTKTLCAHGGVLGLPELQQHVGLSTQQLEETLAAAAQHFLVLRNSGGDGTRVLAVSAVRVCVRKECGGCDRLHLCKLHLMGKCNLRHR